MRFTGSALAGGSAVNDRPYAAQARQMCPESDEHHDRVWFCLTCRGLETRLTPVSEFLAELLSEEEPVTIRAAGSSHTTASTAANYGRGSRDPLVG